ncbi:MAG: tabA [Planctomycetaceae bacterium]|nr:tabA [Planctomycetaceae bacterium]
MILDQLVRADLYAAIHPGFASAFEFLRTANLSEMSAGRHEIDGDRMYVVINRMPGRGREGAKFEVHRKYIDIQFGISGTDEMAWLALPDCTQPIAPFEVEKDMGFFKDAAETWVVVPPGSFAIFFPQDVHAPLGGKGDLVKAVVKVAVDWK